MSQLLRHTNLNAATLLAVLIAAWFLQGIFGVVAIGIMLTLCALNIGARIAVDESSKHGISEQTASRCGGVLIWLLPIAMIAFSRATADKAIDIDKLFPWPQDRGDWSLLIFPTLFFFMGLVEDVTSRFDATPRVLLQIFICGGFLYVFRDLMPEDLDLPILNWLLAFPWLSYTVLLVCMVGFINASNTSDGANGLLIGSAVLIGCVFIKVMPEPYIWIVLVNCWLLFLLLNVTTGRMFLGDGGSYLLGSLFSVGFLWMYKVADVSFVLILCLVFYPVMDFLMAMARRIRHRRPLMEPDEYHFHNLLHNFISHHVRNKVIANSATGLCIATVWPGGVVAMLYLGTAANSETWLWVFGLNFVEFGIARRALLNWTHKHCEFKANSRMELDDAAT